MLILLMYIIGTIKYDEVIEFLVCMKNMKGFKNLATYTKGCNRIVEIKNQAPNEHIYIYIYIYICNSKSK